LLGRWRGDLATAAGIAIYTLLVRAAIMGGLASSPVR